jgi:hypothetical protein
LVIQHLQVLVQWFFYVQPLFAKSVTKQACIELQACFIEMDHGILDYFLVSALKSQQAEKLPPAFLLMKHDWSILPLGRILLSSRAWGWWWL